VSHVGRSDEDAIKLFGVTSQLIEHDLDRIEREYAIDLGRAHHSLAETDEAYYPQIESAIRAEAAGMAPHYEVFYSLERTIRALVKDSLEEEEGAAWWDSGRIPGRIKTDAESRQKAEIDRAVTPRSDLPIDYTNFGELGEIVKSNWDIFGQTFTSVKAVERVTANLNTLRGPIAHCSPLAEDEVVRLRLSVRDWFRLME
jgi:Swt1-like HEPN